MDIPEFSRTVGYPFFFYPILKEIVDDLTPHLPGTTNVKDQIEQHKNHFLVA